MFLFYHLHSLRKLFNCCSYLQNKGLLDQFAVRLISIFSIWLTCCEYAVCLAKPKNNHKLDHIILLEVNCWEAGFLVFFVVLVLFSCCFILRPPEGDRGCSPGGVCLRFSAPVFHHPIISELRGADCQHFRA